MAYPHSVYVEQIAFLFCLGTETCDAACDASNLTNACKSLLRKHHVKHTLPVHASVNIILPNYRRKSLRLNEYYNLISPKEN